MLHNSELAVWRERASEQKENNNNKNSNTTAAQPPSTLHRSLTRFFPVSILYTIRNANEPSLTLYCGTFHAHFRIRKIYWYRLSYVADSPRVCVWRFEWVCKRSLLVPRSFTLSHISALFHLANPCHNLFFSAMAHSYFISLHSLITFYTSKFETLSILSPTQIAALQNACDLCNTRLKAELKWALRIFSWTGFQQQIRTIIKQNRFCSFDVIQLPLLRVLGLPKAHYNTSMPVLRMHDIPSIILISKIQWHYKQ